MHESFQEAWRLRFGTDAPQPQGQLEQVAPLVRHRSIRHYSDRPVSEELAEVLVGCAQSAATSSNLQLWSVVSVKDPVKREAIAQVAENYRHIVECSWFFAFIADHHRIKTAAQAVGEDAAGLDYSEFFIMAVIDAALAAERMVCAAETLGLGICYIGAMRNNPEEVSRLLGLPEQTFCTFGLCIGWPSDDSSASIKPRLSPSAVWHRERYNADTAGAIAEYDRRMSEFYLREKMKGEVTWSMRSGRRVDNDHLTGREVLKPWLEERGFNRR